MAVLAILSALPPVSSATRAAAEPASRQPATLPFDADAVEKGWFDVALSYRTLKDSTVSPKADDLLVEGRAAWAFRTRLEGGIAIGHVSRDFGREDLGRVSGFEDTLGWLKYRFPGAGSARFSAGAFVSLPTGDDARFLGSGNVDPGIFFAGGVATRGEGFVQAHVGLRANGDFDNGAVFARGKTSILSGFGGSFAAPSGVEAFASFLLETPRYDGGDTYAALEGGARWVLSRGWRLQVLGGIGLSDAAPALSLGAGFVYLP